MKMHYCLKKKMCNAGRGTEPRTPPHASRPLALAPRRAGTAARGAATATATGIAYPLAITQHTGIRARTPIVSSGGQRFNLGIDWANQIASDHVDLASPHVSTVGSLPRPPGARPHARLFAALATRCVRRVSSWLEVADRRPNVGRRVPSKT